MTDQTMALRTAHIHAALRHDAALMEASDYSTVGHTAVPAGWDETAVPTDVSQMFVPLARCDSSKMPVLHRLFAPTRTQRPGAPVVETSAEDAFLAWLGSNAQPAAGLFIGLLMVWMVGGPSLAI